MPPSGSFGNRDNENAQKLAIYDRLGAQNERLSLDQQKTQFEQAFRESEQQRKISATEDRLKISQERLASNEQANKNRDENAKALQQVAEERLKLREDLANRTQLLKEQHELTREKATSSRVSAALDFYKGMGQLNPQSPDFQQKYSDLMGKVYGNLVDSEGKIPEEIQSTANHLFSQHNAWAASQSTAKTTAIQNAVVNGALSFGRLDDKGKLVPNTQGDVTNGKATHVSALYADPTNGRMVSTPPMTIKAFQKFQGEQQPPLAPTMTETGDTQSQGAALDAITPTIAPPPSPGTAHNDILAPPAGEVTQAALKPATDDILRSARAAITAGKDAAAVADRLKASGYDPSGL